MVTSDLLSENPDQAISQFGPHRVVADRWKGMNEEQLRRIREEQQRQLEEKKVTVRSAQADFDVVFFSITTKKNDDVNKNGINVVLPKRKRA